MKILRQNSPTGYFQSIFQKYSKSNNFFKTAGLFRLNSEDKPKSRYISKTFSTKPMFLWKISWLFGLFSEDKGDYSDVWMIKIKIKANEIEIERCFPRENISYKNHVCPHSLAFLS